MKDDVGKANKTITSTIVGPWKERKQFIVDSNRAKTVHCCYNLHSEIATLNKCIPSGVDLHLSFTLNDAKLFLNAANNDLDEAKKCH